MTLWKDSKRANAQQLINWLLGQRVDGGWALDTINSIAFTELIASSQSSNLNQSMAIKVLNEMSDAGKKVIDDFEEIYQKQVKEIALTSRSNEERWDFFIPIGITLGSDILRSPSIDILGKRFLFLTRKSVENRVNRQTKMSLRDPDRLTVFAPIKGQRTSQMFLSVNSHASSWDHAWKDGSWAQVVQEC